MHSELGFSMNVKVLPLRMGSGLARNVMWSMGCKSVYLQAASHIGVMSLMLAEPGCAIGSNCAAQRMHT